MAKSPTAIPRSNLRSMHRFFRTNPKRSGALSVRKPWTFASRVSDRILGRHHLAVVFVFVLAALSASGEVVLSPLFGDHAVLQREKPVPVWGAADPGEEVTVEFRGQTHSVTADDSGRWQAILDPMPASAVPADLVVTGNNTVTATDLLVGEVWLCSGQSNMAWPVRLSANPCKEVANANHPQIRYFKVPLEPSVDPHTGLRWELATGWIVCSPETVGAFSAVAFFFARELNRELEIPIGLVNSSWGGTPVESWMSADALAGDPHFENVKRRWEERLRVFPEQLKLYEEHFAKWQAERDAAQAGGLEFAKTAPRIPQGYGSSHHPSALYNGMIHPLLPLAIRGVIWYQGESNADRFNEYATLFPGMIRQWRQDFAQGEFPFYFVQIANLDRKFDGTGTQWAFQREAQTAALELPNTGMAVTVDIGESDDIHPKNKQDVGRRLALLALARDYNLEIETSGPQFVSAGPAGHAIRVVFESDSALSLKNGTATAFEIAGVDQVFHPADVQIEGKAALVSAEAVPDPVAVRYAWTNDPVPSLFNANGLPAPPFRTDDWDWTGEFAPLPERVVESSVVPSP